jgi:hypothetical protein
MSKLPGGIIAAYSNGIECPNCHTRLEVGTISRYLGAWAGLAAGYLAWRFTHGEGGILGGVLPLLYAFLAFGVVSGLIIMLSGDLRPAPEPLPVQAAPAAHGHDAHSATGSHH